MDLEKMIMKIQFKVLFFNMNNELYQLLLELDYKFNYEVEDYFTYTEDMKNTLSSAIIEYFMPYLQSHNKALFFMIRGLKVIIEEAEEEEDYEKADIFYRCLNKCEEMTFL